MNDPWLGYPDTDLVESTVKDNYIILSYLAIAQQRGVYQVMEKTFNCPIWPVYHRQT